MPLYAAAVQRNNANAKIKALEDEIKRLHLKLAGETLRADQGWERYEAANRSHMACLNDLAGIAPAKEE